MSNTIDITPTWGEVGLIVQRLAFSAEEKALRALWPEVARAFASAAALNAVLPSLNQAQLDLIDQVMVTEQAKQGY